MKTASPTGLSIATDCVSGSRSCAEPTLRLVIVGRRTEALAEVQRLLLSADWCTCEEVTDLTRADDAFFRKIDAAVLVDTGDMASPRAGAGRPEVAEERQMHLLRLHRVGALILSWRPWRFAGYGFGTVALPLSAPVEMVHGVLLALARSRPVMRLLDKQVDGIRRLSESLSRQFAETQNELRLAARLQSEFLPRELPQTGPLRFATLLRPSSWVSGDLFDVFRLDERHWGFYLADAMGHGVAAGLLTMYIRHAIRPKRIYRDSYELVPPGQVLYDLNDLLVRHEFRDSQFVTGWYGDFDTETMTMSYAVAGHPPALLIGGGGGMRELHGNGCVLGVAPGQSFETQSVAMKSGDRLIVYSDGLEPMLIEHRPSLSQMPTLVPGMPEVLRLPADALIAELNRRSDSCPGSLSRADDVSVLVLDVVE